MPAWIPLALLCAACLATSDALTKRVLTELDEYQVLWLRQLWALPLLFGALACTPLPRPASGFYLTCAIALPLEVGASILYIRALRLSPLSLTLPFLALTPLFLLLVPFLLLGERLTSGGICGIALIAIGSYVLNLGDLRNGLMAPFAAILREPGARCMILVAMLYSFTSTLGKQALSQATPLFFAAFYFSLQVALLTPLALSRTSTATTGGLGRAARLTFIPGILYGVMIISHMLALDQARVAYMISVKRLSLLFGVLYGHFLFKEPGLATRPVGTLLMLAGVALITLTG